MNRICKQLIESFSKNEYKKFLQNALGLLYFYKNDFNGVLQSKKNKSQEIVNEEKNEKIYVAYEYNASKYLMNYYFFFKEDIQELVFRNRDGKVLYVQSYFEILGDEELTILVVFAKTGNRPILDNDFIFSRRSYDKIKFSTNFILGAGVNCSNDESKGFQIPPWHYLTEEMEKLAATKLNTTQESIINFQKEIGNTNYVTPQIVKDLDPNKYYETIYNSLYKNFDLDMVDLSKNGYLDEETMYWIASILAYQTSYSKQEQEVLTFNYDNILELILEKNFGVNVVSKYKGSTKTNNKGIEVIHSHGFLPYGNAFGDKDSIVLSSFEYMQTYSDINAYAYRRLYDQLNKTCIFVGNSVVDYEEQKVLRNHHKLYLSKYSYVFFKKSDDAWKDKYKTGFLYELGLIPVFFDGYTDIREYFKSEFLKLANVNNKNP